MINNLKRLKQKCVNLFKFFHSNKYALIAIYGVLLAIFLIVSFCITCAAWDDFYTGLSESKAINVPAVLAMALFYPISAIVAFPFTIPMWLFAILTPLLWRQPITNLKRGFAYLSLSWIIGISLFSIFWIIITSSRHNFFVFAFYVGILTNLSFPLSALLLYWSNKRRQGAELKTDDESSISSDDSTEKELET